MLRISVMVEGLPELWDHVVSSMKKRLQQQSNG